MDGDVAVPEPRYAQHVEHKQAVVRDDRAAVELQGTVRIAAGSEQEQRAPKRAAQLEKILHQRMTVRPEITVVPANTFERTALKEKLIERAFEK